MASNPMQKKARKSFLLGMIVAIIFCLIMGAAVYFLLIAPKNKEEEERGQEVTAYVLKQNVVSGQVITSDMITALTVYSNMVPANYIQNPSEYFITDDKGNVIYTKIVEKNGKQEAKMYITDKKNEEYKTISDNDSDKVLIQLNEETGELYKTKNNNTKEYFKQDVLPTVAKVDLNKNTILTQGMVTPSNEKITDDLRYIEYNMLTLSTTANIGSVIDVRLTLPNGLDLIVISKKEIKSIIGNTIGLNLTEEEILMMESAIVEAYIMKASKLYATEYIEPGNQGAALNTYVPTDEVEKLIAANPNIQDLARNKLVERFSLSTAVRDNVNSDKNKYYDSQLQNIETELQEEIENAKAAREAYLSGLTSY